MKDVVSIYAGLPTVKNLIHPPSDRTARSHICHRCNKDTPKFDLGPGMLLKDPYRCYFHSISHVLKPVGDQRWSDLVTGDRHR